MTVFIMGWKRPCGNGRELQTYINERCFEMLSHKRGLQPNIFAPGPMKPSNQTRREALGNAAEKRSRLAQTRHTTAGARSAAIAAAAAADRVAANAVIVAPYGGGGVGGGGEAGGGGGRGGDGDSDKRLKTDMSRTMVLHDSANMTQMSRQQEEERTLELAKRTSLHTQQPPSGCYGLFLTRKHSQEKPMLMTYTETEPPYKIVLEKLVHAPMLLESGISELQCEENRCTLSHYSSCDKYFLTLKQGHMKIHTLGASFDVMIGKSVTVCGDDEVSLGPNCNFKIAPTKIMAPKHSWEAGPQGGAL